MDFANNSKTDSPPAMATAAHTATAENDTFDVSGSKGFNIAMFLCWTAAILSIAGTIFFWLLNNSAVQAIKTKSDEKQQIISEISSPSLSDVEIKATTFKSAVGQLSAVSKTRYSMDTFLTSFYGRVAANVKITNISVGSDGIIALSGSTVSYRAVADQIMLLKDWKINDANILKNVKLGSVSANAAEGAQQIEATFLISASIDKTKTLVETPKETTSTDTSDSTASTGDTSSASTSDTSISNTDTTGSDLSNTGGSDASIQ